MAYQPFCTAHLTKEKQFSVGHFDSRVPQSEDTKVKKRKCHGLCMYFQWCDEGYWFFFENYIQCAVIGHFAPVECPVKLHLVYSYRTLCSSGVPCKITFSSQLQDALLQWSVLHFKTEHVLLLSHSDCTRYAEGKSHCCHRCPCSAVLNFLFQTEFGLRMSFFVRKSEKYENVFVSVLFYVTV